MDSPTPSPYDANARSPSYFDVFNDDIYGQETVVISHPEQNMAVVATLVGLIIILCIILGFVTLPPFIHMVRRKMPVSQKRIEKRFATIDNWLVTKVCHV